MSRIRVTCDACEFQFQVESRFAGRSMSCPNPDCQHTVTLRESSLDRQIPDAVTQDPDDIFPELPSTDSRLALPPAKHRKPSSLLLYFACVIATAAAPLIAVNVFVSPQSRFKLDTHRLFGRFENRDEITTQAEQRQPGTESLPESNVSPHALVPESAQPEPRQTTPTKHSERPSIFVNGLDSVGTATQAKFMAESKSWPSVPAATIQSAPSIPPVEWVQGNWEWQQHKDGHGYTMRAGLTRTSYRSNGLRQTWTSNGLSPPSLILTYSDNTGTTGQIEYGTVGTRVQFRNDVKGWTGFGLVPYDNPGASTYRRYQLEASGNAAHSNDGQQSLPPLVNPVTSTSSIEGVLLNDTSPYIVRTDNGDLYECDWYGGTISFWKNDRVLLAKSSGMTQLIGLDGLSDSNVASVWVEGGSTNSDASSTTAIESEIASDFNGFKRDNLYRLANGQIWEQVDFAIRVGVRFRPDVLIYENRRKWRMLVEGMNETIEVRRVR
jgi:hypothetical protein